MIRIGEKWQRCPVPKSKSTQWATMPEGRLDFIDRMMANLRLRLIQLQAERREILNTPVKRAAKTK